MWSTSTAIWVVFHVTVSLQETYEQKRQEHVAELQKKEEEMRQMFVVRVKEKEAELKDAEKDVSAQSTQGWTVYEGYGAL